MEIQWKVGMTVAYPFDNRNTKTLCFIPETAARRWLKDLGYQLHKGVDADDPILTPLNRNQWHNKIAICVEVDRLSRRVVLLYNHDGRYQVLKTGNTWERR